MSEIAKNINNRPPSRKGSKLTQEHKDKIAKANYKGGTSWKYKIGRAPRPRPEQCELCGALGVICFDHNHATGEFRGWLCRRCNITLGMVKDNRELLLAMVNYLLLNGR